jgi:hypothetical protein
VAFGILGDAEELWQNQAKAVTSAQINYTAAVSVGVLIGEKMRAQGFGRSSRCRRRPASGCAAPTSSTAPPRPAWTASTSASGKRLREYGVHVLVIRPGQVRTTTTLEHWKATGAKEAPFTVNADDVAELAVTSAAKGKDLVWAPGRSGADVGAAAHPAAHLPQAADLSMRTALATVGQLAVAAAVGVSVVALIAIAQVEWPAYPSSNQLHALTTVGQVGCLVALLGVGVLWRRGHAGWRGSARPPAGGLHGGHPRHAAGRDQAVPVRHLGGPAVPHRVPDPAHRQSALHDMTTGPAAVLPARLVLARRARGRPHRHPGLGDVQAVGHHLDRRRSGAGDGAVGGADPFRVRADRHHRDRGGRIAYSSPEPYSAIITVLIPPVLVLAWSGLRGGTRNGGWAAVVGVGLFLGVAATFYTLLLAYTAFTVVVMALLAAIAGAASSRCCGWRDRGDRRPARGDHLAAVPVAGGRISAQRHRQRPALPARRRRRADVPDAAVLPAGRPVHARHALAGVAGAQFHPGGAWASGCCRCTRGRCCRC